MSSRNYLPRKLSRSEGVIVDFCADTCSLAEACRLLDRLREFVGCDADLEMLTAAGLDLLLAAASKALDPRPNISGGNEEKAAAKKPKEKRLQFWLK